MYRSIINMHNFRKIQNAARKYTSSVPKLPNNDDNRKIIIAGAVIAAIITVKPPPAPTYHFML
jgi:hypothetical protein